MIITHFQHIMIGFNYRLRFHVANRNRFIMRFRIDLMINYRFKYLGNNHFLTPKIDDTKLNMIIEEIIEKYPFLLECLSYFLIKKVDNNVIDGLSIIQQIKTSVKLLSIISLLKSDKQICHD